MESPEAAPWQEMCPLQKAVLIAGGADHGATRARCLCREWLRIWPIVSRSLHRPGPVIRGQLSYAPGHPTDSDFTQPHPIEFENSPTEHDFVEATY